MEVLDKMEAQVITKEESIVIVIALCSALTVLGFFVGNIVYDEFYYLINNGCHLSFGYMMYRLLKNTSIRLFSVFYIYFNALTILQDILSNHELLQPFVKTYLYKLTGIYLTALLLTIVTKWKTLKKLKLP